MATLVQFLASGVNGAALGTATFVLRGTASSAAAVLYTDFESTAQPGTNIITLDANGAAEIYCDAYADVTLKTAAGATLRTVTIGNSATLVEVQSDSFTGTDYSGSPTAAGEPITLAAVLNKWDNSAGADDWKVLVGGVATNLSSAFAAIAGLFFNVKDPAYGAVGDGVTDDTTAIGLAITACAAAGGGIVFFPTTSFFYKFTTLTISTGNITLMGASMTSTILKSASTTTLLTYSNSTAGAVNRIQGLTIQGTGASANPVISFRENNFVTLNEVHVNSSTFTGVSLARVAGAGKTVILVDKCLFTGNASNGGFFSNLSSNSQTFWKITDSKVIIPAGFTGNIILGPDFNVSGCIFDCSAVTSGVYRHVNATSNDTAGKYLGRFVNNTFLDGGSTGFAFQLVSIATDSDFEEDNNKFEGFTAPAAITSAGQIYNVSHNAQDAYKVSLKSRIGRTIEITHNSTGTTLLTCLTSYENVFINYTAAGNMTVQMPIDTMTNGSESTVVIQNNNASARNFIVDCGESVQTYGSTLGTNTNGVATNNDINGTSTVSTANAERFIFSVRFSHFGSGSPLAFVSGAVSD